ncbi:hypothetical protein CFC21_033247 [Triticum aestivum]|uniref:Uncharacterized protein n=3 Tax=Triticum TaxID=4564 RepID=A0A9R0R979_TRITD|nr:keratin-associated protein 5-9-like [Triticum aestivum]KAF7020128.1 hypothetical protein CFC21_033247 [Triticum aestivum]VAH55770.1 unnamed protein product [Triticum turgidum subsp. durum]
MAAGGASLLAAAVFSMLVMSSLGYPRPLCSDCDPQCHANCTAEVKTSCSSYCSGGGGGPREGCRRNILRQCIANGICCSSNGTCTCDCNVVAESGCKGVTDATQLCDPCMRGIFGKCFPTCKKDCNNNCKKKGCHHA